MDSKQLGGRNLGDRLTFLGHSTVLVDLDGVRVLTDPVLGHLAGGAFGGRFRWWSPARSSISQPCS